MGILFWGEMTTHGLGLKFCTWNKQGFWFLSSGIILPLHKEFV